MSLMRSGRREKSDVALMIQVGAPCHVTAATRYAIKAWDAPRSAVEWRS